VAPLRLPPCVMGKMKNITLPTPLGQYFLFPHYPNNIYIYIPIFYGMFPLKLMITLISHLMGMP
jgi:hypothetical protein